MMNSTPRILTARTINQAEWMKNTTSIYEYFPFSESNILPLFISKFLINIYSHLHKHDLIIGTRLFSNRKQFDVIITASVNQAVMFVLLNSIFRKMQKLLILEEIYINEPVNFIKRVRPFFYRLFLKEVDVIRASSTREIVNYSRILKIDSNKFWFLPYPSPIINPVIADNEGDYILSAGKQYRDYATLIRAVRGTGYKLIIVSDPKSMKDIETYDEVTVFYNISKQNYLEILLKSKIVVVPLSNDFVSCGQIALLEAMSYGKPVIVAEVAGSIDYIIDGKTGFFYEKGNAEDLHNKICLLYENQALRDGIAMEALNAVNNTFNQDVFVAKHFQFISDKWSELYSSKLND